VLFRDGAAERSRTDHLDVRSMPQDVHEDFLRIAVRYFQLQPAIGQRGGTLLRVPLLFCDPPRGNSIEVKRAMLIARTEFCIRLQGDHLDFEDSRLELRQRTEHLADLLPRLRLHQQTSPWGVGPVPNLSDKTVRIQRTGVLKLIFGKLRKIG
jgi:hypothetical protein